jgi:hypothetical protein
VGHVDACSAFDEVVRLVQECGRIDRRANRVAVWCDAAQPSTSKL